MAELQTSYTETVPVGYAGMVANGETSNRITRTCEDSGGIGFGKAVFRGTGDHGCTATVGTTATFLGVTIATAGQALIAGQDADEYQQYDNVPIMPLGTVWVVAGEDVADGSQVYADDSTGAFVDTSTDNILLTGWFFDSTATSGNLVRIARR